MAFWFIIQLYPTLVQSEQSNYTDWINFCLIPVTDQNIALLLPDSCRMNNFKFKGE